MGKITLLVGGAVGYVLGTRAGRERYDQIKAQAKGLWQNPKVQQKATQAQELAKHKAQDAKDKAMDKAGDATGGTSDQKAPYPTSASTGTS